MFRTGPITKKEEDTPVYKSRFNVPRFNDNNSIYINLVSKKTSKTIYTLNLKDFMKYNQDLGRRDQRAMIGTVSFQWKPGHSSTLGRRGDKPVASDKPATNNMKRYNNYIASIGLLIVALLVTSCSDEEEIEETSLR